MNREDTNEVKAKKKVVFLSKVFFGEDPRNKMFKAFGFLLFSLAMTVVLFDGSWADFFGVLSFIFLVRTIEYFIEWRKEKNE